MAEKETVEVEVNVKENGTEETAEKFSKLQTRIRETRIELQKAAEAGDQTQFNRLRNDLDDLEDQLAATTLRSKNLTDTLSQIPGPLGNIAAQTGGALDKLKAFSQLKIADLKLSFAEFGKDLKGAAATIGNLTGITKVYTVLNNALARSFTAVGVAEGAAATGARAFAAALTATGIGALVVAIGFLINALVELGQAWFNAGEKAAESYEKLKGTISDIGFLRDQIAQKDIINLRLQGASDQVIFERKKKLIEDEIADIKNREGIIQAARENELANTRFLSLRDEKRKEINEKYDKEELERKKLLSQTEIKLGELVADEVDKRRKEQEDKDNKREQKEEQRAQKAKQRQEQLTQQRLKDLEAIAKAERDAFVTTLEEQDQEEYAVNEKYVNLIYQATLYKQDTTLLEEARLIELERIRKKYADKELEKKKKDDDEIKKQNEETAKEILARLESDLQEQYDAEINALETRYALGLMLESTYQDELYNIKARYAQSESELRDAELEGIKFFMGQVKQYADQYRAINAEIAQSYIDLGNNIATVFSRTAQLFEQGSTAAKVFGVLSVVANAASGIAQVIIENQKAQAAYNRTANEGVAAIAAGAIKLTNPITAPLGIAEMAAGKAAIATATAGKVSSKLNAGIQIGTIAATSAAQIAAILSAKKDSANTVGAAGGAGGGGGTTTIGLGPQVGSPQVGAGAFNQQGQIAGIVAGAISANQSGGRPLRAYVVGNDITTEQQLERRLRTAARLGG